MVAGALLEPSRWRRLHQVNGTGYGYVADGGQPRRGQRATRIQLLGIILALGGAAFLAGTTH